MINHLINILLNIRHSCIHSFTRHLSPVLFYSFILLAFFFFIYPLPAILFLFNFGPLISRFHFFFTVHSSAFFSFIRSFTDLLSAVFLYLFIHGPFFSYFRFVHSRSICLFVSFHSPFSSCFFRGPPFSSFIHFLSTYQLI